MNGETQTGAENAQIEQFIPEGAKIAGQQEALAQQTAPAQEAAQALTHIPAPSQTPPPLEITSLAEAASPSAAQSDGGGWADIAARVVYDITDVLYQIFWEFMRFLRLVFEKPHAVEIFLTIVGVLLVLFFARKVYRKFRPVRLFNNSAGVVEVSRGALNELAESVCYGMGALNKPDINIYTRRGRLCIKVALALEAGQSLAEISYKLQHALTIAFREHLGVEKLGGIDVKILAFKGLVHKPIYKQIESSSVIPTARDMCERKPPPVNVEDFQVEDQK